MNATANVPALVPEIPTDETLPAILDSKLDWAALSASVEGVNGKDLLDGLLRDELTDGEAYAQRLRDEDSQLKTYDAKFDAEFSKVEVPLYFPSINVTITAPAQLLIDLGESVNSFRLNVHRRIKEERQKRAIIFSDIDVELKRRAAEEARRLEAEQRRQAEADKQRQLASLAAERAAAVSQAQPVEVIAELDAETAQVQAEEALPAAVSIKMVAASIFKAPGRARKDVCWRTVKRNRDGTVNLDELAKLYAYLGSEEGRGLLSVLHRVKSADRTSDESTVLLGAIKKDMTSILPGVNNARGSEG